MKLAFLYAGQGSQKVGMGRDFYNEESIFREIFDLLPPNLRALCFDGSAEELGETQNTQPALLAFAAGVTALLKQNGITPDIAAGLSLGEYSALTAAGVWDAQTAISLVRFRGEKMALATKGRACKMAAVIGMPRDALAACCAEASKKGVAEIANYNCPNQLVIGGDADAVDEACGLALAAGARRCLPLAVSGAFHTSLMRPAANALEQKFKTLTFGEMRFPIVFNCTANELQSGENVPALLVRQVQSGVYFEDTLRYIAAQGVDTVIEIGAGRGIGRAICLALAAKKINLIVNYKSDAASAEKTVSACEKLGVKVLAIQGDVSTKADCEKIAAAALRAFGSLDILVNNAGVTRDNLLMRMTEDEWSKVLDTNLKSAYLMTQAAVRPMLRARSGRIVNIASVVGLMGNVGQANYAASKAGLIGLTKSVAREFAAKGVTVNAVAPGFIRTDMTSKLPEEAAEKLASSIPQGRFGDASDVANAVAFLTDDSSAYITGQVLAVDGGMTMR